MNVYEAINSVQAALAKTGISKDRTNTQGSGYKFRGIDDVYNALAPLLAVNGLCILPRVLSRECAERQSKAGAALFYVTLHVEFDLVATDGSKHVVATFGEAMDSGDKATNKAMSAAYKYMAMQVFAIPTEGNDDADAHTHEVAPRPTVTVLEPSFELMDKASNAAHSGTAGYAKFWKEITADDRLSIGANRHADFKAVASEVQVDA